MKKINVGLIVAVEMNAVIKKYGYSLKKKNKFGNYLIYQYSKEKVNLFIIESGIGEIAAASATQLLISKYNVSLIINFGVVGSLRKNLDCKKIVIINKIVHYDFDISEIDKVKKNQYPGFKSIYITTDRKLFNNARKINKNLLPVICASGDKFVGDPKDKNKLSKLYNADICEMESAGVILTSIKNKIPSLFIKIIADSMNGGEEEYYRLKDEASSLCFEVIDKTIDKII